MDAAQRWGLGTMHTGRHLLPCAERAAPGRASLDIPAHSCLPCPWRLAPPGTAGQHATGFALCPSLWLSSFQLERSGVKEAQGSTGQGRVSVGCAVSRRLPSRLCLLHRRDRSVPRAGFHLPRWKAPRSEVLAKAGEPENITTANVKEPPATARSKAAVRTSTRPPDLHGQQR